MIVGMVRPDSGHIFLDDVEMTEKPMFRRARLGVGYLPQEASIFRKMSVQDNIMAILETQGMKRAERKERLEELLDEFKIAHIRHTKAMSCSGGERRRLEIARALAASPDFLLLDEPFAGIDPIAVADIQSVISSLRDKGMGVLITDHNVRETLSITNRAYIMYKSQVLTEALVGLSSKQRRGEAHLPRGIVPAGLRRIHGFRNTAQAGRADRTESVSTDVAVRQDAADELD